MRIAHFLILQLEIRNVTKKIGNYLKILKRIQYIPTLLIFSPRYSELFMEQYKT